MGLLFAYLTPLCPNRDSLLLSDPCSDFYPMPTASTVFKPGDEVFVRNWSQDYPGRISRLVEPADLASYHRSKGRSLPEACASAISAHLPIAPHYEVTDHLGGSWLISLLQLSSCAIRDKKR